MSQSLKEALKAANDPLEMFAHARSGLSRLKVIVWCRRKIQISSCT